MARFPSRFCRQFGCIGIGYCPDAHYQCRLWWNHRWDGRTFIELCPSGELNAEQQNFW